MDKLKGMVVPLAECTVVTVGVDVEVEEAEPPDEQAVRRSPAISPRMAVIARARVGGGRRAVIDFTDAWYRNRYAAFDARSRDSVTSGGPCRPVLLMPAVTDHRMAPAAARGLRPVNWRPESSEFPQLGIPTDHRQ